MRAYIIVLFFLVSGTLVGQNRLKLESTMAMPGPTWDVWGYYDSINQKEYALVGSNGITIVDITDPSVPVIVANITGVAEFDHKVWKNYIYSVTGNGNGGAVGHIIDISDPTQPVLVDSFPSAHNLFIDNQGYMYASNPGVTIYNLNIDPTKPDSLWRGGVEGHDVTVVDDMLFDFHGHFGTNIYDVSDRSNPVLISFIDDPWIEYHHQGWVSKDGRYLYICDELARNEFADISIWDISNLDDPERVGSFSDNSSTVHNIFVVDDWAYTSYYAAGIRIFDVEDPTDLIMTDEYDTTPDLDQEGYEGVFGIYPFARNNKLLVSDRKQGLFIFSFDSTRTSPIPPKIDFDWSIFPTITNDKLNVTIRRGTEDLTNKFFEVTMHNALGQLVLQEEIQLKDIFQKTYRLASFQKGLYHFQIRNDEQQIYQKVLKF